MTGTADTEAYEFQQIYGLEVVVVPTNKPCIRKDCAELFISRKKKNLKPLSKKLKNVLNSNDRYWSAPFPLKIPSYLPIY